MYIACFQLVIVYVNVYNVRFCALGILLFISPQVINNRIQTTALTSSKQGIV